MSSKQYDILVKDTIKEVNGVGWVLEHRKTKAKVVLIDNNDKNKVFYVAFRTPPENSLGAAHVVEHSVLCGSKRFPNRNLFEELEKGSLYTFLNALTFADKTVYPVASCNDQDFDNLVHVYLDAVFFPMMYKEERIFAQEGWHYELADENSDIKMNGVVLNEVKDMYAIPEQIMKRTVMRTLYPDTSYRYEAGGDFQKITKLSYEEFLQFHRTYYHPSNCYIYLYGNMDFEAKLNWIDKEYLSKFEYAKINSTISVQKPFYDMARNVEEYLTLQDDKMEQRTFFSYSVVCGEKLDVKEYIAFQVLAQVLVNGVGAPVKQALVGERICNEVECYFEKSIQQPYFSINVKGIDQKDCDRCLNRIMQILKEITNGGLACDAIVAAINNIEFQYREADFQFYPKGLIYGLQILDSWLYDDRAFVYLKTNEVFAFLRKKVGKSNYFENLITRYLINNPHSASVCVKPKMKSFENLVEEEKRLCELKGTMNKEEISQLINKTADYYKYQNERKGNNDIPKLGRMDISEEVPRFKCNEIMIENVLVLHQEVFSNDIVYIKIVSDLKQLEKFVQYIKLLCALLGKMDTFRHSRLKLNQEIKLHTGGYNNRIGLYHKIRSKEYSMQLELSVKMHYSQIGYMLELFRELIIETNFFDENQLREIIFQEYENQKNNLSVASHMVAFNRSMAYCSELMYYNEQVQGVSYLDFLCKISDDLKKGDCSINYILSELCKMIFVKDRMHISITSDLHGLTALEREIPSFIRNFPDKYEKTMVQPKYQLENIGRNEGIILPGNSFCVARVGKFDEVKHMGHLKVLETVLTYDYFYRELRLKGGAYGVICGFTREGVGYFVSYKDPYIQETNKIYMQTPRYLNRCNFNESEILQYIIGTVRKIDTPLTPRAEGERSYNAYISELTWEDCQHEREEILTIDGKDISYLQKSIEEMLNSDYMYVVGGEKMTEMAGDLLENFRSLY